MNLSELVKQHGEVGIRWKTYPNPMRNDGVFVAEDKVIDAYENLQTLEGHPVYPATPDTEHSIGHQLPYDDAVELVRLLNAYE